MDLNKSSPMRLKSVLFQYVTSPERFILPLHTLSKTHHNHPLLPETASLSPIFSFLATLVFGKLISSMNLFGRSLGNPAFSFIHSFSFNAKRKLENNIILYQDLTCSRNRQITYSTTLLTKCCPFLCID